MSVPILPNAVVLEMAKRSHRLQHFLWHGIRNSWERITEAQRKEIEKMDPSWVPPRPALARDGNVLRDNNSGEDFLYMHREMIKAVNEILAKTNDPNYPKVEGWKKVPAPDDLDYPVPELPGFGLEELKSSEFYNDVLLPWEERYTSDEYLKSVTLGQLGADIEWTIHNVMHMRWASPSEVGYRPSSALTRPVEPRWDVPAYNFLGDTYSSHVSPIFWKLHGWVDDRIEGWKKANGITEEIKWKGTWVGPIEHDHHKHPLKALFDSALSRMHIGQIRKLEKAAQVIADQIVFDGFSKWVKK